MANNGLSIEDVLAKDEEILWRGVPKKSAYVVKSVIGGLGLTLLGFVPGIILLLLPVFFKEQFDKPQDKAVALSFGLILILFGLVQLIKIIKKCIEYKNVEYALTNNRIILKDGIIGMDYEGIQYSNINSVNLEVGILEKIFNVGVIAIKHKGLDIKLCDLKDCYEVYKKIQKIIVDIQTDIEHPNALRPEENPGYKSKKGKGE